MRHIELSAARGKRLADLHAKEGVTKCKSIGFKNVDSNFHSYAPSPTQEPQYNRARVFGPLI